MIDKIRPSVEYFGWILEDGEFVSFIYDDEKREILIYTLSGDALFLRNGRWRFKWAILGEGKILFEFTANGASHTRTLRIYPIAEREQQSRIYYSGINGPLNVKSSFGFTALVRESPNGIKKS